MNVNNIIILDILKNNQQKMIADDQFFMIDLYFSGRNLKDLDVFSKSDPFLAFRMQKSMHGNI